MTDALFNYVYYASANNLRKYTNNNSVGIEERERERREGGEREGREGRGREGREERERERKGERGGERKGREQGERERTKDGSFIILMFLRPAQCRRARASANNLRSTTAAATSTCVTKGPMGGTRSTSSEAFVCSPSLSPSFSPPLPLSC